MRKLHRPDISLPTLVRINNEYDVSLAPDAGGPSEGQWNNPDVRGALYAMHGLVCAYCQKKVSDDRGDVEHFRPKSVYRWLVYAFSNYLLSCRPCNSHRKGNRFPLAAGAEPVTYATRSQLDQEKRLLLDPAQDPVEVWVQMDWGHSLYRIEPTEAARRNPEGYERVRQTIDFFRLNTNTILLRNRIGVMDKAIKTVTEIRGGNAADSNKLRKKASRYKPFGIYVRHLLRDTMEELLPTRQEEIKWHVDSLLGDLTMSMRLLKSLAARPRSDTVRKDAEKKKEETCWSLAVLWKNPPPGISVDEIKQWIDEAGYLGEVQPYYDQL